MKKDSAKNTVKSIALATAAVLPMYPDNVDQFKEDTYSLFGDFEEKASLRGVEESVCTVQCDYLDWFKKEINVPGTDITLKMRRKPLMRLNCAEQKICIPDWGVDVPLDGVSESAIRLCVVKQYLRLCRAAVDQVLNGPDAEFWHNLLRDVDYGDYCEQVAPMVWSTGKKIRTTPEGVYVSWDGKTEELLTGNFAEQLSVVSDGESFAGMVKFRNFKLSELSNVSELPHYGAADHDLSWLS